MAEAGEQAIKINGVTYHRLCSRRDIDNVESKGFELQVNEKQLKLFCIHKRQQLHCYLNQCPHTGITLEWMPDQFLDITGELIQCATHGALFSIKNGLCIRGPCAGQSLIAIEHVLLGEDIFVRLG